MFAVLGAGEAFARLLSFAGTVWVARRMGASAYGIIAVAVAIVSYFNFFADWSVEIVGARSLAQRASSVDAFAPPLIAARLLIATACVVVLVAIGLLALPQPDGAMLAAYSFSLLAIAASTRFVFLGLERPMPAALARAGGGVLTLALLLAVAHDAGDLGRIPATSVAGDLLVALVLVLILRRAGFRLPMHRDPALVRATLGAASPLVLHGILGLVIFNSDLIFLRWLRGASVAGYYAAAYTLISFLLNLGITYGNSLLPALSRLEAEPPRQRALYDDSLAQVLALGLPVAAGGALLAGGLMSGVFGAGFAASALPLRILIWSIVASLARTVAQMGLIARHQQAFVLRTSAWSAAANLVLNVILIPPFGMVGAACATLITEVVRTVIALVYAARLGLPVGIARRLLRPVAATAAMALVIWRVPLPNVAVAVVAGAAVYFVVLALSGGIRFAGGKPVLAV